MKVIALIPAYNSAKTIAEIVQRIPRSCVDEIIVVDDGSRDNTLEVLKGLKDVIALSHDVNRGYGAAQITLHRAAVERGADVAVILHSDGGHFPEEIPDVIQPVIDGKSDVVVGSRSAGILQQVHGPSWQPPLLAALLNGPMPGYKLAAHIALTWFQNFCYGTNFHCFHSGFRSCSGETLRKLPFEGLTSWYDFDTEFLLLAYENGLRIAEVPVKAFYDERAGSGAPSIRYGLRVVQHALRYRLKQKKQTVSTSAVA